MGSSELPELLWSPSEDALDSTRIGRFLRQIEEDKGLQFPNYEAAWKWSVTDLEAFWGAVWDHFEVGERKRSSPVLVSREMPGTNWFPGARLNYAEYALRSALRSNASSRPAIISRSDTRGPVELSESDLLEQVGVVRKALIELGVVAGDRVAAYLPNIPETVILLLATASIGAIFSSCAPEFGFQAVFDRFSQIEPVVLVGIDGYRYGKKVIDKLADLHALAARIPSIKKTVVLEYLGGLSNSATSAASKSPDVLTWDELADARRYEPRAVEFTEVEFDHPLYVLYSSGTTGLPKPIVHCHGGILLEHLKAIALQSDIGEDDRFFWFSTTGWMMWNYLISGLLVGACVVLFDGDPGYPDLLTLWRLAEETGVSWFGTSAPFLMSCRKADLNPSDVLDLSSLKAVGSTGAPLPPEGAVWVHEHVSSEAMLSSISGGTDVCTAFVGGCGLVEVRAGEIPCRWLGASVHAFDPQARSVVGVEGELVVTQPMPSMPVFFWGDTDGGRLRSAYFERFPGVWCHGDWITVTDRGSCVITGRSDATLNRGGVRMGTAEFYTVVEGLDGVSDSLVVHLDDQTGGSGTLVLLVVSERPEDELKPLVSNALRKALSPRHVPDEMHVVKSIPKTLSGKKLELPVKRVLMGEDPDKVASKDALVDPAALDEVALLAATRSADAGEVG